MKYTQEEDKKIIEGVASGSWDLLSKELRRPKEALRSRYKRLRKQFPTLPPMKINPQNIKHESIETDYRVKNLRQAHKEKDTKLQNAFDRISELETEREALLQITKVKPKKLPVPKSGDGEAVAVVVASDWHIEEQVIPEKVNYKNEFTPEIARKRATEFFQNTIKLLKKEQAQTKINELVLALLGDFISGNIHEEIVENVAMRPGEAIVEATEILASGIQYLLDNSDVNITTICHCGNHSRITKEVHVSTEQGNSLEWIMYKYLAKLFGDNPRIKFYIPQSYHYYYQVFDNFIIRTHHGHAIKYGGGIGGIYIPANKAIAQWQKIDRADLDIFGHFHSRKDGGNFICNGSLIGYSPYAITIKGDFEKPAQTFFLIDKKRGKTIVCPITFSI